MSALESLTNAKDYASNILAANVKWAQKLNQTFPQYFPDPNGKQAPKIFWIGCSDSRVQESDATTALPGTVFVHRNIANQFRLDDDNAISVLAYAVKVLGVQHIAVVGHEQCGGAAAALQEATSALGNDSARSGRCQWCCAAQVGRHRDPPQHHLGKWRHRVPSPDIQDRHSKDPNDALTRWLAPLVDRVRGLRLPSDPDAALRVVIEENVKMQVENLVQLNAWVGSNAPGGKKPVWVHGWVYDFSTGFIRDLEVTRELAT